MERGGRMMNNLMDERKQDEKPRKKSNKFVVPIILGFFLLVIGVVAFNSYQNVQEREAAEKRKIAEKEYKDRLDVAYQLMVTSGANMEDIINGYTDVWHSAIWDDGATIDGQRYTDFNEALAAKLESYTTNGDLDTLDSMMSTLNKTMDRLKNPPNKYEDEYEAALNAYAAVKDMNNFVEPTGSYDTYSSGASQQDNEMSSELNNFEVRIK